MHEFEHSKLNNEEEMEGGKEDLFVAITYSLDRSPRSLSPLPAARIRYSDTPSHLNTNTSPRCIAV